MQWVLWLAIAASLAGLTIRWQDLSSDMKKWLPRGLVILQILPFFTLTWLFISDSTSYDLVRLYGGAEMPFLYRVSAVWAGREGPTLLWAGLLALSAHVYQLKGNDGVSHLYRKLVNGAVLSIHLLSLMMRPFRLAQSSWRGELNPLLQTDLMVLHPPLVYLFYSLCMVVMLQALAVIINRNDADYSSIQKIVTPAARASFVVGTIGIGLGGLWAYTVLDWGGYWAWDPVETASLLPWLCLLLLLHLRVTPNGDASRFALPLAILPGWFSIHATMVTRANGVWASVHAFVGDDVGAQSDSAILRLIELQGSGMAGTEVLTYLLSLVVLLAITISFMVSRQASLDGVSYLRRVSQYSLWFILMLPLSHLVTVDMFGAQVSLIEQLPFVILLVFASASLLAMMLPPNPAGSKLFASNGVAISMAATIILAIFIDEAVIAVLLILLMLLKASSQKDSDTVWTVAAVIIILTSVYAYLIDIYVAATGLLIFIWPILVQDVEDDEEQTLMERVSELFTRKTQLRLALYTPLVIGGTFLSLTWMLMIASVDGTSLAMHEMFGSPLIFLVGAALATYAWKDSVSEKKIPLLLLGFFGLGISLGIVLDIPLPGDSASQFSDVFNRGAVAWLLLPMLIAAIPSLFRLVYGLTNRTKASYSSTKMRSTLAHAAHLGILLLLVGHIFTTTLVDRNDSSHQVMLVQGDTVTHEGMQLTFTEWEIMNPDDSEFTSRFSVGDGYLGAVIEIRDVDGNLLDIVNPGMLRFDASNSFPRSEVDRYSSLSGDTIFIFDWSQTQALGNASDIMTSPLDSDLDRVRLTVYHLPGSHLVWLGWLSIIASSLGIAIISFLGRE